MAISIPYTFVANTDIIAAEVNANFDELTNALDKRGDTLTGNLSVSASVTIDGVDISAVIGTGGTLLAVNGAAVTALNASNLASGTVGTARLGSGTASSSTFLRGDSSWQAIAPGGSDTYVQFNDGSAFGGDAGFTYNKTTDTASITNISQADGLLSRPEIKDYSETTSSPSISGGTLTLNIENGNVFTVSLNANISTLTISNPSPTGKSCSFLVIFTADGTVRTITWPASVLWAGGLAPTMTGTSSKRDIFMFVTTDAGTTWYAFNSGQNF